MLDRVTITKFSVQDEHGYNQTMFNPAEIADVRCIKVGLTQAADKVGRQPPEIVLSVILIPNWKKEGNSYNDSQYKRLQEQFIKHVEQAYFHDSNTVDRVHDFYHQSELTVAERGYLHGLGIPKEGGLGSVADMLKTHSIFENAHCRHLNIDSNTKIVDFELFYNATFNAPLAEQQLLLNASFYDNRYVSTHNKIVYTPDAEVRTERFADRLRRHCELNIANEIDKRKNSVYSKAFVSACAELGISTRFEIAEKQGDSERIKVCFQARLSHPAYRLTSHVVTAINMSWAANGALAHRAKNIPAIFVGDAMVDWPAYQYVVKKHTQRISYGDDREQLLSISNTEFDYQLAREFFIHAVFNNPEMALSLVQIIPANELGKKLCEKVFGMSLENLNEAVQCIDKRITEVVEHSQLSVERLELHQEMKKDLRILVGDKLQVNILPVFLRRVGQYLEQYLKDADQQTKPLSSFKEAKSTLFTQRIVKSHTPVEQVDGQDNCMRVDARFKTIMRSH